jgi:hypothetical protein
MNYIKHSIFISIILLGILSLPGCSQKKDQEIADLKRKIAELQMQAGSAKQAEARKAFIAPLIRSIQAIRGSIETGVSSNRYSELVGSARAAFSEASMNLKDANQDLLLSKLNYYISRHQLVSTIWNKCVENRLGEAYLRENEREMVERMLPHVVEVFGSGYPKTIQNIDKDNIGALLTEADDNWAEIEALYRAMN